MIFLSPAIKMGYQRGYEKIRKSNNPYYFGPPFFHTTDYIFMCWHFKKWANILRSPVISLSWTLCMSLTFWGLARISVKYLIMLSMWSMLSKAQRDSQCGVMLLYDEKKWKDIFQQHISWHKFEYLLNFTIVTQNFNYLSIFILGIMSL